MSLPPWLKVRCDLHEDVAVIAAAAALAVSENEVVGALIKFWSWANRETTDGNAPGVTKVWLDRYVSVTGFADALVAVGWLHADGDGIRVPKFDEHNSESAKKRAQSQRRTETCRSKPRPEGRPRSSRSCNADVTPRALQKCDQEEEEEIEEEQEEKTPLTPQGGAAKPIPRKNAAKEPEGFAPFWEVYPRKEAKQAAVKAFARLAPDKATLDLILAAVERQKRRGCLEPRSGADGRSVIPHPATWLNGRRWEDAEPPAACGAHVNGDGRPDYKAQLADILRGL